VEIGDEMKDTILTNYEIRKSNKEKSVFIDYIKNRLSQSEYDVEKDVTIEGFGIGIFKTRNIIVGNPDTANVFVTAHYDTCAVLPFPNVMSPTNPLLFIIYQILIVVVLILMTLVVVIPVAVISRDFLITYYTFLVSLLLLTIHMMFGYRNKHTANDNTSGVIAITKILEALPLDQRHKVCAVYFDNEEKGLFGSANFVKKHKKNANDKLLLNFDCIGDGDYVATFAKGKAMKDENYALLVESLIDNVKDLNIKSLNKKVLPMMFPSDNIHFEKGIGLCALKKSILGLYTARIHTPFDTKCSETNIDYLTNSIIDFVRKIDCF